MTTTTTARPAQLAAPASTGERQPRERLVPCQLCPASSRTRPTGPGWTLNISALCDRHGGDQ